MAPRKQKTKQRRMEELFGDVVDLNSPEVRASSPVTVPPTPGRSCVDYDRDSPASPAPSEGTFFWEEDMDYLLPPPTPGHDLEFPLLEDAVMYSPSMAGKPEVENELPTPITVEPYEPSVAPSVATTSLASHAETPPVSAIEDPRNSNLVAHVNLLVIPHYPGPKVVMLDKDPFPYVRSDRPSNSLFRKLHNKKMRELCKLRKKQAALLKKLPEQSTVQLNPLLVPDILTSPWDAEFLIIL
jgi:hypothetical protein